jgi:hypothetical protein
MLAAAEEEEEAKEDCSHVLCWWCDGALGNAVEGGGGCINKHRW